MPIITLTTDLGIHDHYVGALKGTILSQFSEATIIDITHLVPPFNIHHAAYILKNAYESFPTGSIHLIGVNVESSGKQKHLAIYNNGHYFIGADNGVFSLLFDKTPDKMVDLSNIRQDTELLTFPVKDIFVKAACHIARGGELEILGLLQGDYTKMDLFKPAIMTNSIQAVIIYIDSYGNVVLNITRKLFDEAVKGRSFAIEFPPGEEIRSISKTYSDVPKGEIAALFNSAGYLEISMCQGKIAEMYGTGINNIVTISIQ
jgi:S-adenosyl-L-methionine hydrolase (adenosine-forming)